MIEIAFVDADSGEQRTVTATDHVSQTRYGVAPKRQVTAGRSLSLAEAQDIADRALVALGGRLPGKWFVTIEADRLLCQGEGLEARPATAITDYDTVDLDMVPAKGPLLVQVLNNDRDAGKVELGLTDGSEGRMEMELELMNLAHVATSMERSGDVPE